jgi:transposase InsO family protein
MTSALWITFITCIAYHIHKELYDVIDYLNEQVQVLLEKQEKQGKRIILTDNQRIRIAAKARKLSRENLVHYTKMFTPDTIIKWYHKLIAQKYDGSKKRQSLGRPKIAQETIFWILKLRRENPRWGSRKIADVLNNLGFQVCRATVQNVLLEYGHNPDPQTKTTWAQFLKTHWNIIAACDFFSVELLTPKGLIRCMVFFAIDLSSRKVEILGVKADPDGQWMMQIARNITDYENGFLKDKKYLIHDRDPLYTYDFHEILKSVGVEPIKLPAQSPNLNAYAERFVKTIKEECLNHLILSTEEQLRYVLSEFMEYYHTGRIHQGLDKIIDPKHEGNLGQIVCIERLGGLLKSYHRKVA